MYKYNLGMDTKELMMIKMENQNHSSDPFLSLPLDICNHADTPVGFMELLGFQDITATNYSSPSTIFDNMLMMHQLPPSSILSMDKEILDHPSIQHHLHHKEELQVDHEDGEESSVVLNVQPSSPANSSSLSSPAATVHVDQSLHKPLKQSMSNWKKKMGEDDHKETKTKKNKEKEREARFAFMTRSEIDHLDDGYRWRKYGQKAVKNSAFPRSYYRCTSASCNVKKRVERCMDDPSCVVTTYQGKHNHPTPTSAIPYFNYNLNNNNIKPSSNYAPGGLLQDIYATRNLT